jgi:hypothetical protein
MFRNYVFVENTYMHMEVYVSATYLEVILMQVVEVSESFRLFGTITTSKNDVSHALEGMYPVCDV